MDTLKIITAIIEREKGYVDHPDDAGGPTNDGITQATARSYGYEGDMKDLPTSLKIRIYTERYIVNPGFDKISRCSPRIAEKLIDMGVNIGPTRAAIFFQKVLNAFNLKGSRYSDVFVDGKIGPVTQAAFCSYMEWRKDNEGEDVFVKALDSLQGAFYLELAETKESQESFVYGWFRTRIGKI